ncbi:ABC transporter permease, partial [Sinirhodobacter populi]
GGGISGTVSVWTLGQLPAPEAFAGRVRLDDVGFLDTAGAWYLLRLRAAGVVLEGLSPAHAQLVAATEQALPRPDPPAPAPTGWRAAFATVGRATVGLAEQFSDLGEYLGRFLAALWRAIRHPREFPLTALVYHCEEMGLRAVPIVTVMSFLIGVVLAFQGASQLSRFGAEIFVVDLIAISLLRELGILLTSIVVAGRTASALTASIGSMKMQEEIDAMRTLGLDPDMMLVLPRVLALVLMLPILGLISNVAGLIGGGVMSWVALDISPSMFTQRLVSETSVKHAIVGLSKAPVFAVIIGIVGCRAGMKVGKDATSLGMMTSTSVVQAIFAVIVADALFSIFFSEVGM